MLVITPIPATHCVPEDTPLANKNRFECRTCPYQMVLDRRYYERRNFDLKPVDDVMGGEESWKNVDKTEGPPLPLLVVVVVLELSGLWLIVCSAMPERAMREPQRLLPPGADPQRRRADDEFLQVCGVWYGVAGELITHPYLVSPPLSLWREMAV